MNSVEIQDRRRLVFKYHCIGLTPHEMLNLINTHYSVSIHTIWRDLRNMDKWLPQLSQAKEDEVDKSTSRLLAQMHMAQQRLTELMFQGDNPNTMVGAAKGLADMVIKEAELRMDVGLLHRVPDELHVEERKVDPEAWFKRFEASRLLREENR